jgi:hypothetical protein
MGKPSLFVLMMLAACGAADDDVEGGVDASDDRDGAIDAETDAEYDAGRRSFTEDFGSGDAGSWPAGWSPLGGVASATVENGRARLVPEPSGYTLGRMGHALFEDNDEIEVTFTLEMHDVARQGVGLYVRQNGGYLTQTSPTGAGYAVFVEGFAGNHIGLWRERDGSEEVLVRTEIPPLQNAVPYTVHFQVWQEGGVTELAASIWRTDDPATRWSVSRGDTTPGLQSLEGGIAVDAWNTVITGGSPAPAPIYIDDILAEPIYD